MACGSAGSKSRLSKAAGAEVARKWHAAVARSTCASQNAKKLTGLAHCWKLGFVTMARRCGAKHICKSKCQKAWHARDMFGPSDLQKWHAAVAPSAFTSQM